MSRTVRITVGAVVAGTLAFVALVAGVVSATTGMAGPGFLGDLETDYLDAGATAEVLDVDDDWDWPTVDVRWTTPDDEVVVTFVDWEWTDELPEVGDDVAVVYDSADPEWAFAADDPYVSDSPAVRGQPAPEQADDPAGAGAGAEGDAADVAGWVSLGALVALLVTVVVTVVAAVRAPAPDRGGDPGIGPYGPDAHLTRSYPPQPYLEVPPPPYASVPSPPWPSPPSQPSQPSQPYGAPQVVPAGPPGPAPAPQGSERDGRWSAP